MRPTIPLGPWRLAIDLVATRAVNALDIHPAHGCTCADCGRWAERHGTLLSSELADELRRIGIDPARPSDAYGAPDMRVTLIAIDFWFTGLQGQATRDAIGS